MALSLFANCVDELFFLRDLLERLCPFPHFNVNVQWIFLILARFNELNTSGYLSVYMDTKMSIFFRNNCWNFHLIVCILTQETSPPHIIEKLYDFACSHNTISIKECFDEFNMKQTDIFSTGWLRFWWLVL